MIHQDFEPIWVQNSNGCRTGQFVRAGRRDELLPLHALTTKHVSSDAQTFTARASLPYCAWLGCERILAESALETSWHETAHQYAPREADGHTSQLALSDRRIVDGGRSGNSVGRLKHACAANGEAVDDGGRIFIETAHKIIAGEARFIRYCLEVPDARRRRPLGHGGSHCGAAACGTMLTCAGAVTSDFHVLYTTRPWDKCRSSTINCLCGSE